MTDNVIERICTDFFDKKPYWKLREIIQLNINTGKKHNRIIKILGDGLYDEIECLLYEMENEYQSAYFIAGFKYAMQLMLACGGKNIAPKSETN